MGQYNCIKMNTIKKNITTILLFLVLIFLIFIYREKSTNNISLNEALQLPVDVIPYKTTLSLDKRFIVIDGKKVNVQDREEIEVNTKGENITFIKPSDYNYRFDFGYLKFKEEEFIPKEYLFSGDENKEELKLTKYIVTIKDNKNSQMIKYFDDDNLALRIKLVK